MRVTGTAQRDAWLAHTFPLVEQASSPLREGPFSSLCRADGFEDLGLRDIAVSIEETSPPERLVLFARAFGLSTREAELLGQLAAGGGTRDLARQMFLSEHAVQDYLKSIFTKTSVRSRRALLSRVLGT